MSVYTKMTALADEARTLSGTTDKKSIDEIIEDVTDANEEITDQSALIAQILDAVNNLPEAKGDNYIDVTDITRGESDVIVDEGQVNVTEGYYPSRVVKEIPSVEQATPTITVFSTGQIIAKATQAEGYVSGGTRQKTTQLTTQAAKTVTPTTTNQTAVASGRYTTGAVTVKGDTNLKAENIKKGVSIFGVSGAYEGDGGGSVESCTVTLMCDFGDFPMPLDGTEIYYTDANMTPQNVLFDADTAITISVAKNTIVFLTEWSSPSLSSSNIVAIGGMSGYKGYWVKGDGTLTYRG